MLNKVFQRLRALSASPEIVDGRSRRFVAVIDCILNQNVRDIGAAQFPAMNFELLRICHEYGLGVLQMTCPEIAALGFNRARPAGQSIRDALDNDNGRACCSRLAVEVASRIETYVAEGYELVAVLGGNPRSPGCAVNDGESGLRDDSGLFMRALQNELAGRKLTPVFRGIRDADPKLLEQDLQWFREFVECKSREE